MNQPARVDDPASKASRAGFAGAPAANAAADATPLAVQAIAVAMPVALASDEDVLSLPAGHPAWQRDALSVSSRVRTILATLRPFAVRVLSFWDHAVRAVRIGRRTLEVDPSGCYRMR